MQPYEKVTTKHPFTGLNTHQLLMYRVKLLLSYSFSSKKEKKKKITRKNIAKLCIIIIYVDNILTKFIFNYVIVMIVK